MSGQNRLINNEAAKKNEDYNEIAEDLLNANEEACEIMHGEEKNEEE